VAVVVANAPYVPTAEIAVLPREAREPEHREALDGGPDGLDVQRRVIAGAGPWLRPGGHVLVETGRTQLMGTLAALRGARFEPWSSVDEESGGVVAGGTGSVRTYPMGGMEAPGPRA